MVVGFGAQKSLSFTSTDEAKAKEYQERERENNPFRVSMKP
jgi:hypothetical protein